MLGIKEIGTFSTSFPMPSPKPKTGIHTPTKFEFLRTSLGLYRTIEDGSRRGLSTSKNDMSIKSGPLLCDLFRFFYELLFVLNPQRTGSAVGEVDNEVVITSRHDAWKNEPLDAGVDESSSQLRRRT